MSEEQDEKIRKMQTVIDLLDNELRKLRAARAALVRQLDERRVPWIAANIDPRKIR